MNECTIDGIVYRFYDHLYAVSKCAKVLRNLKPHEPNLRPDGYMNIGRRRLLHRMVATCWLIRPDGANHVHHKNHIKTSNHADNLEWLTQKSHALEHITSKTGRHVRTDATRQKNRDYRAGKTASEETKQKQREASIRLGCKPPNFFGMKHSEETLKKMSENSRKIKSCEVNGVIYRSFTDAAKALGEKPLSLRRRCLSKNFPNYKLHN